MRSAALRLIGLAALFCAALGAAPALAEMVSPGPAPQHLHAALVAEHEFPEAGSSDTILLQLTPEPGWHGYWQSPGEAGFAPSLKWTLPPGASISAPRFPVPEKLVVAGLTNHVFNGAHALVMTLNVPKGLAQGTHIAVHLDANYLVCSAQICVPEQASLDLPLIIGNGAGRHSDVQKAFDDARAALPQPLGSDATVQVADGHVRLSIPYPASAPLADPWLFAVTEHVLKSGGAQKLTRDGDTLRIEGEAQDGAVAGPFDAVLSTGGHHGLLIHAVPGSVATGGGMETLRLALLALGGALLGGLILNVMPCVFPVIGLKALSLARGGADERHVRRESLAYAAGVILTCLVLGGLLLALRAAGHAVGWAFQLQDPRVILLLLVLVTGITANLLGLFELRSVSAGDALTRQSGVAGSFWTGALAAFVATPCTGPFMAGALGAAVVLPTVAALMIFAGLGLGMALPFLALGYIPALRTRLPKPGAWMRRFQQVMAIPMALTAVALIWLLWRQAGLTGLLVGSIVAGLAVLALWLIGANQREGLGVGARGILQVAVPSLVGVSLLNGVTPPAISASAPGILGTERFSEARLSALRSAHRPVFVYFTADWCLTCKVNEKAVLETDAVAAAFKAHNIAVLEGDWTNGDAAISHFLEAHGRSGVPFYLYFPADGSAPKELPQVLSVAGLTAL